MKVVHISKGGQLSLPAPIRHRWATDRLVLEDRGEEILLRPLPPDPVAYAKGSLPLRGVPIEEVRERMRADEARAERRARPRQ